MRHLIWYFPLLETGNFQESRSGGYIDLKWLHFLYYSLNKKLFYLNFSQSGCHGDYKRKIVITNPPTKISSEVLWPCFSLSLWFIKGYWFYYDKPDQFNQYMFQNTLETSHDITMATETVLKSFCFQIFLKIHMKCFRV